MYSDFHMQGCFLEFDAKMDLLAVDYCREGRVEWELSNGIFMYMKDGDIQVSAKKDHTRAFGFPLGHYHGVTVAVYIDEASKALSSLAGGFSLNLRALREKYCSGGKPILIKATDSIRHIFAEFYNAPQKIRMDYFKLKALELLLLLDAEDDAVKNETTAYFPKKQVEAVKAIKKHLVENIDKHFTLEELSEKFGIPLTPLKSCFKSVYGTSVYAFVRSYRIHAAAALLRENGSVIAAAGKVGYANPSKFANAFKVIMGISPTEYKRKLCPNGAFSVRTERMKPIRFGIMNLKKRLRAFF